MRTSDSIEKDSLYNSMKPMNAERIFARCSSEKSDWTSFVGLFDETNEEVEEF